MTEKDLLHYYMTSAVDCWETAEALFKVKKYNHCLFFCHLALEKLIKGLVFKNTKNHALPIHKLGQLAAEANIKLSAQQILEFKEITSWNIKTRYDNIKFAFYKKATESFSRKWFVKAKGIFLWLKNQY
ncbi:HEPN domain-containing protein [Candidatus Gottesmanbacteria bacterium]|nr:HEPN domain-containing protein [Candidatus Gottesmanbacteria bacterium]